MWGWNESGQLALPSKALAEEQAQDEAAGTGEGAAAGLGPQMVPSLRTAAVSTISLVWGWGGHAWGPGHCQELSVSLFPGDTEMTAHREQLAAEDTAFISIQAFPALLDLPQELEVSAVSCGSRHTAALTRESWGPAALALGAVQGQQGPMGRGAVGTVPACGTATADVLFAVAGDGQLYTWGWGKCCCGSGTVQHHQDQLLFSAFLPLAAVTCTVISFPTWRVYSRTLPRFLAGAVCMGVHLHFLPPPCPKPGDPSPCTGQGPRATSWHDRGVCREIRAAGT